jgi:hypothetical protein
VSVEPDAATVLEAGRAIRPFLGELALGPAEAATLDRDLAEALADAVAAPDERAATTVFELLIAHQVAAEWLLDFAELGGLPPALDSGHPVRGGASALGQGGGSVVPARRFRCPAGNDYVWYRRTVAQPIGTCPTHQVRLVPDVPAP